MKTKLIGKKALFSSNIQGVIVDKYDDVVVKKEQIPGSGLLYDFSKKYFQQSFYIVETADKELRHIPCKYLIKFL